MSTFMMEDLQITDFLMDGEVLDEWTQLPKNNQVTKYLNEILGEGNEDLNVALCIIDIDYFQRYNDFHGHSEGNRCLIHIADCMKAVMGTREGVLSRFDGDEFICLLTDIRPQEFAQFTETLREAVERLRLLFCWEQHSFQVTISVGGVHGLRRQFEDKAEMLSIAGEELNKAKSTGRNKVKIKFK